MNQRKGKTRWSEEDYRNRPRDYDPLLCERIIDRVSNGETLPDICASDPDMPLPGTFLRWCNHDDILNREYMEARRNGAEILVDEAVFAASVGDPVRAGVLSRAIMWQVEKTDPERYGPRASVNLRKGEDKGGGIDYRDNVRRRLETLSKKHSEFDKASKGDDSGAAAGNGA